MSGPVLQTLVLQQHLRRSRQGVIVSHYFEVAAVARALLFNYHNPIERFLFGAKPRQANHQHLFSKTKIFDTETQRRGGETRTSLLPVLRVSRLRLIAFPQTGNRPAISSCPASFPSCLPKTSSSFCGLRHIASTTGSLP